MFIYDYLSREIRDFTLRRSKIRRSSINISNAIAILWRRRLTFALAAFMLTTAFGASILSGDPPTPPPTPPNVPPTIVDFVAIKGGSVWTFQGQVLDESPQGLVITFGGLLSNHPTTVTAENGYFWYSVALQTSGTVSAHTVDLHGLESDYEEVIVEQ